MKSTTQNLSSVLGVVSIKQNLNLVFMCDLIWSTRPIQLILVWSFPEEHSLASDPPSHLMHPLPDELLHSICISALLMKLYSNVATGNK